MSFIFGTGVTDKISPLLSLYPGIKEARPGYTPGYNSG